ncbi:MAG TPA: HEAT repeat domain-containing protein, partial [Verrucomicrobiae bacterium]|nr:HEAT repeat domain-containing protein [Verrucomicrobiae bacterium]
FVEIMDNLVASLIHAGRGSAALKLVRLLKKMEGSERFSPEKRAAIAATVGSTLRPDTVLALLPALDGEKPLAPEEAMEFFDYFGPRHCASLVDLLARLQSMKIRKATLGALVKLGRENPASFLPFLQDQRWFLVRNIIFILGQLGYAEGLDHVARLAAHPEQRVRKEVLGYLQRRSEPRARAVMMRFLQDENVNLRVRALQALGAARYLPALKNIEAMAEAKDFAERTPGERIAVYEALGLLAGESMLPRLREMLKKRFLFGRARDKESVACAVAALRRIRTPGAVRVLEEAEAERRGTEVSMLIADALKEVAAEMPQA